MDSVIKMMVENNIVRYNMNGNMKWHGKVQQDEIPKFQFQSDKKE